MITPTNPTPAQQAEAFREEIRGEFAKLAHYYQDTRAQLESLQRETGGLRTDIENLQNELHQMKGGLATASQPAPTVGTFGQMIIDTITMTTDDNGKPAYKAKGTPYQKHGVRIWPETLPLLGIDPASLKPGPNQLPQAISAHVLMGETADDQGNTRQSPRKVTGRA